MKSSNLGYPRIGQNREWKKALEAFWAGKLEEADFHAQLKQIRLQNLKKQQEQGIEIIPVGDFTYYDHILDTAVMFGLIPTRFEYSGGKVSLATYYDIARGNAKATAGEMTKWFNTNYHYIVPELNGTKPVLTENRLLTAYREAKQELSIEGRPVLVGPYTLLKLSKGYEQEGIGAWIEQLLPLYAQVLTELEAEGVTWIQIDEPIIATTLSEDDKNHIAHIYDYLTNSVSGLNILLQTYFEAVDDYEFVIGLPVHGIGLDFVHDRGANLAAISKSGFPAGKVLSAGVIDGRGIWKADLYQKLKLLIELNQYASQIIVAPSNSLLHVPVTTAGEVKLDSVLSAALSFADEKLAEIVTLAQGINKGETAIKPQLIDAAQKRDTLAQSASRDVKAVHTLVANLTDEQSNRKSKAEVRRKLQEQKFNLPLLPTTTIGSFPQTPEVRAARQKWRKQIWSEERYTSFIENEIKFWIEEQEKLNLDVLVHGEFERTDMVEFFGEKLEGFAFTSNGWVQSYGSRCVKPPVIYGDIDLLEPMTVKETVFAQSLTKLPVKGMLTGPITILNWSFVRDDIPRKEVAYQIAFALQKEVEALENAGIGMIQVDEPALREGLPLKREQWEEYLDWSVRAFKLSTATVQDETQIHTHMCYSEFHDIIDDISALDADVISIETSRSHGELVSSFESYHYDKGIGLGVYDIHSPRVPSVEEMTVMIDRALRVLDPALFWINPDCGLKTRKYDETVAALANMVKATEAARVKYNGAITPCTYFKF